MSKNKKTITFLGVLAILFCSLINPIASHAIGLFALSPMHQLITLTPGEIYTGNFNVVNPADNHNDFYYTLRVEPFTTDNNNEISLVANGDYNQIVDWVELSEVEGIVSPNETHEVRFTINVPENAAAGGQYVSIVVSSYEYNVDNSSVNLKEVYEASHLIYADVAGETVRKGSMTDVNVPGFLFSGKIIGSAAITNEGNVHSQATHTMQIFPLFSSEEVFTNEENPKKTWIMPGNTTVSSVSWDETPSLGIFHVIYNVEYEGVESKVDKIVIVCPLWLLFLILLAIFLIIFRIMSVKKKSKK